MNGRMLSRAIHRTSPTIAPAAIRTATRGEMGTKRESVGPAIGFTNGGGGSDAAHRARVSSPPAVTDGAGWSMVPQTTRRGWASREGHRSTRNGLDGGIVAHRGPGPARAGR